MKIIVLIWFILFIIGLLYIPVFCYYLFFIHNKKVTRLQKDKYIEEMGKTDFPMDYKEGFIDAMEKTKEFYK